MKNLVNRFKNDESGATAIEYGLIAGVMAVMIIAGLALFGDDFAAMFTSVGDAMTPE